MNQVPPGWYPDPAPAPAGAPRGQRYWDGRQWTEHVSAPAPDVATPAYGGPPDAAGARTTPDGQPLAGWWRRVGAAVLDGLVVGPLAVVAGWSYWSEVFAVYRDLFEQTMRAAQRGTPPPDQAPYLTSLLHPMLMIAAIALLVSLVYNVGFLRWKQATPGKLALGMRVRRRDVPGTLPWSTILVRWLTQSWPSFLGVVPVLGSVVSLWPWVDCLWPLWDAKNQALHDKTAGTNVVLHRPTR